LSTGNEEAGKYGQVHSVPIGTDFVGKRIIAKFLKDHPEEAGKYGKVKKSLPTGKDFIGSKIIRKR
jgi:GrpB-like predicted nucleotidyltransferase (UPF0157 family)